MKKLLILALLLIPLIGWGQEKLQYDSLIVDSCQAFYYPNDSLTDIFDIPFKNEGLWYHDYATQRADTSLRVITLQDLIDYQEYCYGDSVDYANKWLLWGGDTIIEPDKPNEDVAYANAEYLGRVYKPIHEFSFNGFIEWLKNRER